MYCVLDHGSAQRLLSRITWATRYAAPDATSSHPGQACSYSPAATILTLAASRHTAILDSCNQLPELPRWMQTVLAFRDL